MSMTKREFWSTILVDLLILLVLSWSVFGGPRVVQAQYAGAAGFKYVPITTSTNTQVSAVGSTLNTVTITQPGATSNSIVIVDTSQANCTGGTTIATIPSAQLVSAMPPLTLTFALQTINGICVTTAGTTAPQLVVTWR